MPFEAFKSARIYGDIYRAQFAAEVANGVKRPYLLPLSLLAHPIMLALYLAIPHKQRPWLYQARWLVLAVNTWFNVDNILHRSSHNFGIAYTVGLISAWAIIWNLTLLVWTRPQWEAKRVQKVVVRARAALGPEANTVPALPEKQTGDKATATTTSSSVRTNGQLTPPYETTLKERWSAKTPSAGPAGIADKARPDCEEEQVVYEWQEYPEDAPFLTRLGWALDLSTSMRLTGWNWASPVLPPYTPPPIDSLTGRQKGLDTMPTRSRQGYFRYRSRGELVVQTLLRHVLPNYLLVDFLQVWMRLDPYYILGPSHGVAMPAHLADLHPSLLASLRTFCYFGAILSALKLVMGAGTIATALLGPALLGFRADPWQLPSAFGSPLEVLDRGLAGFWGAFWHQTFRVGFTAPTGWLVRAGRLPPPRRSTAAALLASLVAFALSACLHAAGSYSSVPETRPLDAALFFLLAWVGATAQHTLSRSGPLRPVIAAMPRWVRRVTNLAVVLGWNYWTCQAFLADMSRCGVWLFEAVPVSLVRWMGFGFAGDEHVLRWESHMLPRLYVGRHWWETGIGV